MLAKTPNKKQPNPTDVHVGAKVRLRRKQLGMSQEKLAEALGLTFQQVQKYEKGMNRIGASRLQQIALALKVPVEWFFIDLPKVSGAVVSAAPSTAEFDGFLHVSGAMDLVRAFMKLETRQRHLLVKVAEELGKIAEEGR